MTMNARLCVTACGLVALLAANGTIRGEEPSQSQRTLVVSAAQAEHLTLEPILVTVHLSGKVATLPAGLDKGPLQFQITPAVKLRKNAKPLPLEGKVDSAPGRRYDLLEWYEFPAEGTFKIQAVVTDGSAKVTSQAVTITIRRPGKQDAEWGPVDRLHHMPWSNYVTDCFCGDTFDVVKRWPESKLAKYCHYYNGLYSQHKKEYDKAIVSFKIVTENYPGFGFADAANYGIAECLMALGKRAEALTHVAALQKAIRQRPENASGTSCVCALVDRLAGQIQREETNGR
jgi:TolA-binding protein